jgi:hypothetical protein
MLIEVLTRLLLGAPLQPLWPEEKDYDEETSNYDQRARHASPPQTNGYRDAYRNKDDQEKQNKLPAQHSPQSVHRAHSRNLSRVPRTELLTRYLLL